MIDDRELERRLRATFDEVLPRLIERADADHDRPMTLLDTGIPMRRRHRSRTLVVTAAAVALLAGGTYALTMRDTGTPIQGPVTDPSVEVPTQTSAPEESPTTSPSSATPTTVAEVPVDLPGEGTGLHLPDDVLPEGWTAIYAGEWVSGGGGSVANLLWTALAAQYTADRSRVDGTLEVSVYEGEIDAQDLLGASGSPVVVRGVDGRADTGFITWFEGGRTIVVRSFGGVDLSAIAEGLTIAPDGSVAFGELPEGFEQVAVVPGVSQAGRRIHYTKYATEQSVDPDRDLVLTMQINPDPMTSAEAEFVQRSDGSPIDDRFATDVNGRRMIVDPGYVVAIMWDEPDGSRVDLEYGPLVGDTTSQERVDRAVEFAAAIRRADAAEWEQLLGSAPGHLAAVQSQAFIDEALAELGLVLDGYPRQVPIGTASPRYGLLVPVATDGGEPAGTCEFLLRALVACTDPETLAAIDPLSIESQQLDGGYVRIVVGSGIAQIEVRPSVRGAGGGAEPAQALVLDSPSAGIVLLRERAPADTYCITPLDADRNPLATTSIVLGPSAMPLCEPT